MTPAPPLLPFPAQPEGVDWPTTEWEEGDPPAEIDPAVLAAALDPLLGPDADPAVGHTNAVAVVHRGRIVAERYGERLMGPLSELAGVVPGPITVDEPLGSWSMAKSILHLAVGVGVARGRIDPTAPAPVPEWAGAEDPRAVITWDDLLTMRAGLTWTEVYDGFDATALPDVVEMLYGDGAGDMAGFAAAKDLLTTPGSPEAYCYSSGTSNILCGCLQRTLGLAGDGMSAFLREALFDPIGISTATLGFDGSGTWVASSYVDMTTRDWLRLGLLVLRGGTWDGTEVVPAEWIDHGRTPRSPDENGTTHGAHWWSRPERDDGMFMAHGFEGQRLLMSPARDLVVFRQGKTAADHIPRLNDLLLAVVDLFPTR